MGHSLPPPQRDAEATARAEATISTERRQSRGEGDTMSSDTTARGARGAGGPEMKKLLEQYGCGPIQFTGTGDALYERHLMFDNVVGAAAVGARERNEAIARSVGTSSRSGGCAPSRRTNARTPSVSITSPWSS